MAQDILTSLYPPLVRYTLLIFAVAAAAYLGLLWVRRDRIPKGLKPLPGPPRNLIGGKEGLFNTLSPFLTFEKWARQYRPIFQVKIGPQTIISVIDPRMTKELFEKRGSKYWGRLSQHVGYDLLSQWRRIIMTPNGPMHTAFRRQMHSILSISRTKENHTIQELDSRHVLHDLLALSHSSQTNAITPPDYTAPQSILRRYTLFVMMTPSFSHRVSSLHDPMVQTVFSIMEDISRVAQPGQYLVDSFPILRRLPYFLRTWEHAMARRVTWQWVFLDDLLRRCDTQLQRHVPNTGLLRSLLEQRQGLSEAERADKFLDDRSIAYQAMTLMEAGADTTAVTAVKFLLAMLLHPDVMRRGQAAIDAVVPASRLPGFAHLPAMPYVNQIVKEVMRWRPVIIMGVLHANTAFNQLEGYYIPPPSVLFGNMWAMEHDPAVYPSPEEFRPERFEASRHKSAFESSIGAVAMDRDHDFFGWGLRICPGMHLAEASVLLLVARILWAFDVRRARDAEGREIPVSADPETRYENTIIASPKVFPVAFALRGEERRGIVEETYADRWGCEWGWGWICFGKRRVERCEE
jgi:cytochrome P450